MEQHHKGWFIALGALGMFLGLIAVEVSALSNWADATTPFFVGKSFAHLGVVIGAIVGGKFMQQPTSTKE